jgi:hypothetical protein
MSKELTEISPNLTIPGFDVKVKNKHSCQVRSQDGRYEFSVEINESNQDLILSGNMLRESYKVWVGDWEWWGIELTTKADDTITQVTNSLKLMDKLSSEGFSAKIDRSHLVLSHPSKPGYSLRMGLTHAEKIVPLKNTLVYTWVEYCGPAYDEEANRKCKLDWSIENSRLVVTNKDFEELAQELKARVLSLGEGKDPRIAQWVSEEIEKELRSQGFTFTPKPEKGIVELSHPAGLSGTLSFAPFTVGGPDLNPKYPNLQFPTDIEQEKVVLFTLDRPNSQEPYTKGFLAKYPQEVIDDFRQLLALPLVYREVCHAWKSDILVPKLNGDSLQLVNTKIEGNGSIILELTVENGKLVLKDKKNSYEISDDPREIAQTIVGLAENHVQEFIQANGVKLTNTRVVEIDF